MRWIAALALVVVSLAGCSDGADPEPGPDPLDAGPDPDTRLAVEGLLAHLEPDIASGVAPLDVTFQVGASGAGDEQNVSWSLTSVQDGRASLLDGGTGVPATVTHTFGVGNHAVRLEVIEDGTSANETVQVVVQAAGGAVDAAQNGTGAARDIATVHLLEGSFAQGTADPTLGPVPDPGTGPVSVLEFEVPHDATAVHLWVDWDDGGTGNSPLLTDLDIALLDGAGTLVAEPATASFEYAYAEGTFVAGTWRLEVKPYLVPVDTTFHAEVVAWEVVPSTTVFTGTGGGFALGTPADAAPDDHALSLPVGTQTVAARLAWSTETVNACNEEDARPNDFDFEAILAGKVRFGRGSFGSCEFGVADAAPDGGLVGDWTFRVHKFVTAPAEYTLTVFHA